MRKNSFRIGVLFAGCLLLGAVLDFVINGVFKVVWVIIYGPAIVVAAQVLVTRLAKTSFAKWARGAASFLILGVAVTHFLLTGYHRQIAYPMFVASSDPLIFRSTSWPQELIVLSSKLAQKISQHRDQKEVVVLTSRIVDYGCTRSFVVEAVDGVSFKGDSEVRWTWKMDPKIASSSQMRGAGYEDEDLPWCRIQFYRGVH